MLKKPLFDVVVVGGGVVGSSIAFHLSSLAKNLKIAVIEKDPRYLHASAVLSAGGIRQQFSLRENVQMSTYGVQLLKDPERLRVGDEIPDFQFHEHGYLFLSTAAGESTLRQNHEVQTGAGVSGMSLLPPADLHRRFPWISSEGLALGSFGNENEGYFDPWSLLGALKRKAVSQGVTYLVGDVDGAQVSGGGPGGGLMSIESLHLRGSESSSLDVSGSVVVNACGSWSGRFIDMLNESAATAHSPCGSITPLPVRARKRSVFLFDCQPPEGEATPVPPLATPLTVDPSGVWFRPEGREGQFLCGVSPPEHEDEDFHNTDALDQADHHLFEDCIWPFLFERVPAFAHIKVKSSWAGFYEYNIFDQNAVIGPHPEVRDLLICAGFSGHGLQHSPAAGRAIAELIVHKKFTSLDLSRFRFERIAAGEHLLELGIV